MAPTVTNTLPISMMIHHMNTTTLPAFAAYSCCSSQRAAESSARQALHKVCDTHDKQASATERANHATKQLQAAIVHPQQLNSTEV
jgi:hypothetical protein